MSQRASLLLACLAFTALPLLAGCGQGGSGGSPAALAADPPPPGNPTVDLSGVTQNWDKALPSSSRFVVLAAFNNQAVRDNNTGLVWELSPATTTGVWAVATGICINKNVGGQKGWRVPAIAELASLIDPSVQSPGPTLPPGHPFLNVQSSGYWSAKTVADNPVNAWGVGFNDGLLFAAPKPNSFQFWCVRGPMNADQY
jgi:uncharacterized protein DUF1566